MNPWATIVLGVGMGMGMGMGMGNGHGRNLSQAQLRPTYLAWQPYKDSKQQASYSLHAPVASKPKAKAILRSW